MINLIKILLHFGSFKIHLMKIQLSFIISRKIQYIFRTFKIPLLKKIINIVKFYVTFVKYKFCKFTNISNSDIHTFIKIQIKVVTDIIHKLLKN